MLDTGFTECINVSEYPDKDRSTWVRVAVIPPDVGWHPTWRGMTADGRPPDINEQDRKDTPRYAAFIVSSRAAAAGM